ncbi:MAG: hypothetical protein IT186_03420 [Acidobacteria bacterium]|nr:hypothetical protein [Acidobacteriota bacterium]
MHSELRALYNSAYTDDLYEKQKSLLEGRLEVPAGFRLAETPVFLTADLRERLVTAATGIVEQLMDVEKTERMKRGIPERWNVPRMDRYPNLTQVDLAVVRDKDGTLVPKLIELQGFPSLSAFEPFQADAWLECLAGIPGMPDGLSPYFSGLTKETFVELFRKVIVGNHDPENVILMDLEPHEQKTNIDFAATRKLLGVDAVCPSELELSGRKLYRRKDGRRIPVDRIYNRIVFDELIKKAMPIPFDFRDDLDVEWVPHPNWYWTWSKYSLPMLSPPAVPRATYLSEVDEIPADLTENYVLKPLFSFAGGGVNVEPTLDDILRIPDAERPNWCLQEKIEYDPCIRAVDGGGVKFEIRMMFYRPDDADHFTLGLNLCRLSRGKMLGVDFNKSFTWVGSSVALG